MLRLDLFELYLYNLLICFYMETKKMGGNMNLKKRKAFTMAEVLITLGIIGIIAAMTLPGLIKNYQHKILEAQFKKSVSIISQVILKMKDELSFDKLAETCAYYNGNEYPNEKMCKDSFYKNLVKPSTKQYLTSSILYDINRTNENIRTYNNKQQVTTSAVAGAGRTIFYSKVLPDGSFINLEISGSNFILGVDINGQKGPNQLGHDIFLFYLDKNNDILAFRKPQNLSDEEIENGNYEYEYQEARAGDPCNIHSSQKANGIGCAYYALRDECPDGSGSGYFRCLP